MDKGLGTLYQKLTNFFHSNTSPNPSAVPETGTSLPISTFFDRLVPSSTTTIQSNDRRCSSSSRIARQISIKTNGNQLSSEILPITIQKITPANITKQQT
jgi:hypothetical protein